MDEEIPIAHVIDQYAKELSDAYRRIVLLECQLKLRNEKIAQLENGA